MKRYDPEVVTRFQPMNEAIDGAYVLHSDALALEQRAIKAEALAIKWRPINTCNVSGKVLLYWDVPTFNGRGLVVKGYWQCDEEGEGWRGDGDQCIPVNQSDCTHWAPVPCGPDKYENS